MSKEGSKKWTNLQAVLDGKFDGVVLHEADVRKNVRISEVILVSVVPVVWISHFVVVSCRCLGLGR